jgi:hypothetical protein
MSLIDPAPQEFRASSLHRDRRGVEERRASPARSSPSTSPTVGRRAHRARCGGGPRRGSVVRARRPGAHDRHQAGDRGAQAGVATAASTTLQGPARAPGSVASRSALVSPLRGSATTNQMRTPQQSALDGVSPVCARTSGRVARQSSESAISTPCAPKTSARALRRNRFCAAQKPDSFARDATRISFFRDAPLRCRSGWVWAAL